MKLNVDTVNNLVERRLCSVTEITKWIKRHAILEAKLLNYEEISDLFRNQGPFKATCETFMRVEEHQRFDRSFGFPMNV